MFIKNIHGSLCSINLCLENGPGKKCIWKCICQIHQIREIKYKYKYMVWNLIKYKYKYAVFVFANTNTYLTPALPSGCGRYLVSCSGVYIGNKEASFCAGDTKTPNLKFVDPDAPVLAGLFGTLDGDVPAFCSPFMQDSITG